MRQFPTDSERLQETIHGVGPAAVRVLSYCGRVVSRVFLSHSSRDCRQAMAVKKRLIEQEPGLAEEIFLDLDPHTGIRPGERWKEALNLGHAAGNAAP